MITENEKRAISLQVLQLLGWRVSGPHVEGEEWKGKAISKEERALYDEAVKVLTAALGDSTVEKM